MQHKNSGVKVLNKLCSEEKGRAAILDSKLVGELALPTFIVGNATCGGVPVQILTGNLTDI